MSAMNVLGPVKALLAELTVKDGRFIPAVEIGLGAVLERLAGIERRPVLRVLDRLCREGDLELVSEDTIPNGRGESGPQKRNPTWRVVRDIRQRRDNQHQGRITCRDKVWSTLRGLRPRAATVSEISRLTGCDDETVREAMHALAEHGYVAARGRLGLEKAWALMKDAGPKRPETPQPHRRRS